ncbi:MAG TPA: recombinase family protein [Trebonia sp.]
MSLDGYRPGGQPQQKIRPEHLDRAAVAYVRRSTRHQVLEHTESTRLQYGPGERAVALGWARSQVTVIDDDLGVSAAADSRKGFARLVTEVTMGRAGVVPGIEMSRLARSGRDWHQLLELCSLSGAHLGTGREGSGISQGRGPAQSPPLLRYPVHPPGRERQAGPVRVGPRHADHHAEHLRRRVAGD